MTLRLADKWVWDSWPFTDGQGSHHLFYLQADRSLPHPDQRHWNPSIGHAVSTDYRTWTVLPDVIAPSETPASRVIATEESTRASSSIATQRAT